MDQHVCLEVTSCCEGVFALYANKRLFSTVNQHVSFQLCSFDIWVAALIAAVGTLFIMLKHVRFEVFANFEGGMALNT